MISGPLITVTRPHAYLAIAQDGTTLRAFLYNLQGTHEQTLGTVDTARDISLDNLYLINRDTLTLWMCEGTNASIGELEYVNWPARTNAITTKDTTAEEPAQTPMGVYWRSQGSIWQGHGDGGTNFEEWSALTSAGSGHASHSYGFAPLSPNEAGSFIDGTGAVPSAGGLWHQCYDGAGASNCFAYWNGSAWVLAAGTTSAINPAETNIGDVRSQYKGRGVETAYGGIVVLNDVAAGKYVIAHLPAASVAGALGAVTQVRLTPTSWNITSAAEHGLHTTPSGEEFAWYDPTSKTVVRHSANPAAALASGVSLASMQVDVEDAPGGHAIKCLIPLS